jgi:uncharacterized protein involved in type VI secretion and phage assembly
MAEVDALEFLQGNVSRDRKRVEGVTLGVVTDTRDPQGLGRVKVRLPWISEVTESGWARVAVPMAGANRGTYFIPEVEDEVLVAFRHGDPRHPYIIGSLWNGRDRPPVPAAAAQQRVIRSHSGHQITFDDLPTQEKVTIKSHAGHEIVLDDSPQGLRIEIRDANGTHKITLDSRTQTISITAAAGNIEVKAPAGNVSLQGMAVQVNASSTLDLKAGGLLNLQAPLVKIN